MAAVKPAVLLVDDDEAALMMEARALRYEGYDVLTAASVRDGRAILETGHFAAILLDLKLPRVEDGLALLRQFRALDEALPIAVVTGHLALDDSTEAEIRQLKAAIAYKPLWLENILALVRDLLDQRAACR